MSNIKRGFVVNYRLKQKYTKIRTWRQNFWDVIGLWAKTNNKVIAISRK